MFQHSCGLQKHKLPTFILVTLLYIVHLLPSNGCLEYYQLVVFQLVP